MPQVYEMCQRTARGILPRLASPAVESYIDVHRQVVNLTSGLGYLFNVCGVGPRLENLFRINVITKHLRPIGTSLCLRLQFLF